MDRRSDGFRCLAGAFGNMQPGRVVIGKSMIKSVRIVASLDQRTMTMWQRCGGVVARLALAMETGFGAEQYDRI
jgi:hypothetical protein